MKKFLTVYVAPVEAYDKMKEEMNNKTPEDRKRDMEEWNTWMEKYKENIVDPGAAVGSAKRVDLDGNVSDVRNEIGGYMIFKAESMEAVVEMFKDGPSMGVEGGGVEIMEIVEM